MADYPRLKRWTLPPCYVGETWPNFYSAGVGQSRDSSALERSNFDAMLEILGGSNGDTVIVVRESHWAVGWIEWIAIHQDDDRALALADSVIAELDDYPVINEDRFSEYEDDECAQTWENCYSWRERADYLRKHVNKAYPVHDLSPFRALLAAVRGDWGYAANLLPCPSDLIY